MICYDPWTGTMFIADPEDIHEKMAKIQELLIIEAYKPESISEQYYRAHPSKKNDKPGWLDKKQRWQMAKCMQFFDDLSDVLTKDGSYEVKLSANPKKRSCSKCLIPTGTEDQLTYHGKPLHSFRVAYEWNWYANLNKDCRVDYIQCETDDLPRAKKRIGEGLASKPINAVSVGYFGEDQKYHVIYGEKFDRKTKTWSWVEANPKEVLDILKGERE